MLDLHRTVKYSLAVNSSNPEGTIFSRLVNKYAKKKKRRREREKKEREIGSKFIYIWNTWGGVLHKYSNALAATENIDNALSSRILVKVPRRAEQQVPRST